MRILIPVYIILLTFVLNKQNTVSQTLSDTTFCRVYIVKYDWHTSIIFEKNDAIPYLTKLDNDFFEARFLEVSWGDKDFFTSEKGTLWQALKAIFVPTKSVMLISGYNDISYLFYNLKNIQEIRLPHENYAQLIAYVNSSLAVHPDSQRSIIFLKNSEIGYFYLSNEKYHAFKTCNVWTARALKKSGLKVIPIWAIRSGNIMRQVRKAKKKNISAITTD